MAKILEESCLEKMRSSVWDMLNLRCLVDIQVRMSGKKLDVRICNSGEGAIVEYINLVLIKFKCSSKP